MTSEFIETGQTFSDSGAAYCPVERRRRGPAALAVSISVLLAGAGFLTYSIMSTPKPMVSSASPAPAEISNAEATPAPTEVSIAETPPAPEADTLSVEEALAESRAARAGVTVSNTAAASQTNKNDNDVFGPRLKPSAHKEVAAAPVETAAASQSNENTDDTFGPRLKPPVPKKAVVSTVVAARPMRIGSLQLASADDAPPPVFFEDDLKRRNQIRAAAPVALALDLDRPLGDLRIRISKGENFVDALKRAGIRNADRNEAAYAFGKHYNLRRLRPGQEFALTLGWPNQTPYQLAANGAEPEARLLGLEFRIDPENRIVMRRDKTGEFATEKSAVALTTRTMAIAGRINGSLYESAKQVGAPDQIIADLADAFSYDVDFQREIFGGDEFEAIFEVRFDEQGKMVSTGDILYARLHWRGRQKEKGYYRFASTADGKRGDFYDASGQGAKRLLMKTPIDGARLSSGFGSRKHPILGYRRAHKGVDFAARRGTPIKAAGDGVIERANRYGSFGNYVRIRHANGYKTAYAHLKGFSRAARAGRRVRQGDIIGYVGTTGRSTGPHLHYEVHKNGKAVNPQRLKIATTKKLKGADLDRFKARRDYINAMRMPDEGSGGALRQR